jgi:hypothetical protein
MSAKVFLFNSKTRESKLSGADQNGKTYQKYLEDGFEPIALISGFSVTTYPYSNEMNKAWFEEKSFDFVEKKVASY